MKDRIVALIPSRMDSSRLPGKALKKISGIEMIVHVAKRCMLLNSLDRVVVCTDSIQILEVCEKYKIEIHKNRIINKRQEIFLKEEYLLKKNNLIWLKNNRSKMNKKNIKMFEKNIRRLKG